MRSSPSFLVGSRSGDQKDVPEPFIAKSRRKSTIRDVIDSVIVPSGSHFDPKDDSEINVHIRISYKTLVFVCVTFAASRRVIDLLF
jgi:hypothetical protein